MYSIQTNTLVFLPLDQASQGERLDIDSDGNRSSRYSDKPDTFLGVSEDDDETKNGEEIFMSIGIDFGTTYSGVSWSLSTSPQDIFVVSEWETYEPKNTDLEKVPSIITYFSNGKVSSWGFNLDPDRHHISWFKLGLSEEGTKILEQKQPERFQKLQDLLIRYKKSPLDVSADYLRLLWAHAMKYIQERTDDVIWEVVKFKVVLTVPAMWDHKAQDLTRQAAKMAGILDPKGAVLELIGEPEAAALAVFTEMDKPGPHTSLKVGDSFVICDAGGGTVDLISYKIEQMDPLTLSMCAEATGDCCGAIFIDNAFEKQIRTMISGEEYEKLGHRARRKLMEDWEHGLKRVFRSNWADDQIYHVDIPGYLGVLPEHSVQPNSLYRQPDNPSTLSLRINPGTVILKRGHVNSIFSEVRSKIIALITEQRAVVEEKSGEKPAFVIPVGGLGGNRYLKEQLALSFQDVRFRVPSRSWSAVCRGATLKGLGHGLIINHISKYNYGCSFKEDFVEGKHLEIDRDFDQLEHIYVARNQVQWFLTRGESIVKDTPVSHFYYSSITTRRDLREQHINIYQSRSQIGETRVTPEVKILCTLNMKFSTSLFDQLPIHKNKKGLEWRRLMLTIEMKVSSGQLIWIVRHDGVEGGSITTKVEYEGSFGPRGDNTSLREHVLAQRTKG